MTERPSRRRFLLGSRARIRRVVYLLAASAAAASAALVHSAAAAESCVYDPSTHAVTASITPGSAATVRVVGGEIWFGFSPVACGGATTTNTDTISIAGQAGTAEQIVIDQSGGRFAPGFTSEGSTSLSDIEIATALGDASDSVVITGTTGNDFIRPTLAGVLLESGNVEDITFSPAPAALEIHGLAGNDRIDARNSGPYYTGRLVVYGGDGVDGLLSRTTAR